MSRLRRVLLHALLAGAGLAVAFPFAWMVLSSLKTPLEASSFPPAVFPAAPQWANYPEAWSRAPFGRYFFNSAVTATAVSLCVMATALLSGFAFGQLQFPGKGVLFGLHLATMMIPFEVIVIPSFLMIRQLGWYDTYLALIVPWGANALSIFLLTQFFRSLPNDYFEAAQLDGCGRLRYLWSVGAPLARPVLVTAGLFAFLGSWNSLLWPLLVTQSDEMRPIEVGLQVFLQAEGQRPHLLMAMSTVAILPVLALFLLAQRTFIEGVTAGVKG